MNFNLSGLHTKLVWASLLACVLLVPAAQAQNETTDAVSALGRLEPKGGVRLVSAALTPRSIAGARVKKLLVKPGEDVTEGQLLAVIDTEDILLAVVAEAEASAQLARRKAELERSRADAVCVEARVAKREAERRQSLLGKGVAGEEEAENAAGKAESLSASCTAAQTAVGVAEAEIVLADVTVTHRKAELERTYVYAPMAGRVLEVLAGEGEIAMLHGLLELAQVQNMYAIAEVYETDIRGVRVGQTATVSSDALEADLSGVVEKVRQKVAKQDEIGTDPAARKDARIIEVEIRLDNPEAVTALTFLQVEVMIQP